jgi:aldehyde dehydrogenase
LNEPRLLKWESIGFDNNDGSTNFISAARKILSYIKLGKKRELLTGGEQNHLEGDLAGGYYIKPTLLRE